MPDAFQPARTYKSKKKYAERNKRTNAIPKGTKETRAASIAKMKRLAAEVRNEQEKKRKKSANKSRNNKAVLKERPRIMVIDREINIKKMSPSDYKNID